METSSQAISERNDLALSLYLDDVDVSPLGIKSVSYINKLKSTLTDNVSHEKVGFMWSLQAKDTALLLRDALVKLLKLSQYSQDNYRTAEEVGNYKKQLQSTIHGASYALQASYNELVSDTSKSPEEWKHQTNPTDTVVGQLDQIVDQIKKIQRTEHKLDKVRTMFEGFKETYSFLINQRTDRSDIVINELKKYVDNPTLGSEKISREECGKQLILIQELINQLEKASQYASYDQVVLDENEKIKVPIDTQGGMLEYKTVDILSEINGWTSVELSGNLKKIDLALEAYKNSVKTTLQQVYNRVAARLDDADLESIGSQIIKRPIEKLIRHYEDEIQVNQVEKLKSIKQSIHDRIKVSEIYNEEYNFLPTSSVGQLTGLGDTQNLEERYNLNKARNKVKGYFANLSNDYIDRENTTVAEYVSKLLCYDPQSESNALFLRKGYLGSSFTIDRPLIDQRIDKHYQLWQRGFDGSLLVKGLTGAGKTTILDRIPLRYENVKSYHLVPSQKLDVNGHKMTVDRDLLSVIRFIIKYNGNDRCIVTVDDLDYYSNHPENTFSMIASLTQLIKSSSRRIYFACSMHDYMYDRLSYYQSMNHVFTEIIDCNHMSSSDIRDALLIRSHAVASHDDLINKTEELQEVVDKVAKKSGNNIGKAMQLWCIQQQMAFQEGMGNNSFKKMITDNIGLLKSLIIHGDIYDPYLRSMLHEVDAREMKDRIDNLVRTKVLVRPSNGHITINPYVKLFVESVINKA